MKMKRQILGPLNPSKENGESLGTQYPARRTAKYL
jgi:hypothetical protein